MPEMTFTVQWPDGATTSTYSPSLVMHDHLELGGTYTVEEFVARARTGLHAASERVRARYGMACTSAAAALAGVELTSAGYRPDAPVRVLALEPPLEGS